MNRRGKCQAIWGGRSVELGHYCRYNTPRLIIIPMRHNVGGRYPPTQKITLAH